MTLFSCTRKGLNSKLCSLGDFSCSPKLVLMPVQDFRSAKDIRPAGMPKPGMIPADPKLSFRVMMANRKPSMEPIRKRQSKGKGRSKGRSNGRRQGRRQRSGSAWLLSELWNEERSSNAIQRFSIAGVQA
jgi:hypothetical protein